jgi:hypothetical protein
VELPVPEIVKIPEPVKTPEPVKKSEPVKKTPEKKTISVVPDNLIGSPLLDDIKKLLGGHEALKAQLDDLKKTQKKAIDKDKADDEEITLLEGLLKNKKNT